MNSRLVPIRLILTLLVAFLSLGQAAAFDFTKTDAYTREMETRPDFPVSMVLAHDYVYSLLALGKPIEPAKREAIIAFIKARQHFDGGFTVDKASKESSLLFTNQALEILSLVNGGPKIDLSSVKPYAVSMQNPDGGFGFSATSRQSSLASTYYGVRILSELHGLERVNKQQTARYIKEFARPGGGFGYVKGTGIATPQNSYYAVFTLNALGLLDEQTKASVLAYLRSTPYVTGKYDLKDGGPMLVEEQVYACRLLQLLGNEKLIPRQQAQAMAKKFYIDFNGGFGPILGFGSTPDSTTNALRLLAAIGTLKEPMRFSLVK